MFLKQKRGQEARLSTRLLQLAEQLNILAEQLNIVGLLLAQKRGQEARLSTRLLQFVDLLLEFVDLLLALSLDQTRDHMMFQSWSVVVGQEEECLHQIFLSRDILLQKPAY